LGTKRPARRRGSGSHKDMSAEERKGIAFLRDLSKDQSPKGQQRRLFVALDFARRTGPFVIADDGSVATNIPHPASSQATAEAVLERMFELRALRLRDFIELAEKKLERPVDERFTMMQKAPAKLEEERRANEARWLPWREHLRQWLNVEWQYAETTWGWATTDLEWSDTTRSEAHRMMLARNPVSEERFAVELRDLALHALRVRDVDHVMWLDPWVDRWALAVAGNQEARKRISEQARDAVSRRYERHREAKQRYRAAATTAWAAQPTLNIEEMIETLPPPADVAVRRTTLRQWINSLCPDRRPGRRPNARK